MKIFDDILHMIEESNNIIITSHVNPDGDAIGCGLALLLALKKKYKKEDIDKKIRFILQDKYPETVKFLKYRDKIEQYDENSIYDNDLTIFTDSATAERTGKCVKFMNAAHTINIDHHISNPQYAQINLVDPVSSTSEIVYGLIKYANIPLDIDMGECLYTGLVNDTGNFSHDNVTKITFDMAADLINIGVNNSKVVREFMSTKSLAAMRLIGMSMYQMTYFENEKLVFFYLSNADLEKFNGKKEDTESIVERLIEYKEAEVSLFLREENNGTIKGSMRSKHDIDVNNIANIFGGGGHKKAAGFTSMDPPDKILEIIKNLIKNS